MNGFDGRTKGKRFRKPQSGGSNVKERWKYLSVQTDDVVHHSSSDNAIHGSRAVTSLVARQQQPRAASVSHTTSAAIAPVRVGFDIDGDGQIDVREMRLAKFLDAMVDERQRQRAVQHAQQCGQDPLPAMTEHELTHMRQQAGRLLIANEFVERNHDRLWRYGAVFTGKTEQQSAAFIAAHKNFQKLMPFLESIERKRTIRSSQNVRGCVQSHDSTSSSGEQRHRDAQDDARLVRQTWIETSRKVPDAGFSTHPLPMLQPSKRTSLTEFHPVVESVGEPYFRSRSSSCPDVQVNAYGAIDVDGDGLVDDDEMKLNQRLQDTTLGDHSDRDYVDTANNNSRHHHVNTNDTVGSSSSQVRETRQMQQLEGRRMMARDFVDRNTGRLWQYEPSYRGLAPDDVVDAIASSTRFAKEFNCLCAKERVLRLKASAGVTSCLTQLPVATLRADPTNATEFRRVRDRSELLLARRELLKPPELLATTAQQVQPAHAGAPKLRVVREDRRVLSRTVNDTPNVVGLPHIFETPVRIEATGSFSVTKWKCRD